MGRIGVIGGSGLYDMKDLRNRRQEKIDTPFGSPSDHFIVGDIGGKEVVFLPRHGRNHALLPSELNYRANIYGMKKLEVDRLISVAAVGSLRETLKPLHIVIPDQFFDRTNHGRRMTFFGDGIAAHVSFADPVCIDLCDILFKAGKICKAIIHKGGTYINMEGPAFSTRAESRVYRKWGMDIIGMTNMCEAKLAREAEMCFATLAMVTDYDCWYGSKEEVNVDMVVRNLIKNSETAQKIIKTLVLSMPEKRTCGCASSLKHAIITPKDAISSSVKEKLGVIIGKYVK